MTKRHYIPITADVPGASSERNCALIRKTIRTVLALERVALPCEVDVLLTNDAGIHAINLEMRGVDMPTDVLSFPEFEFTPGCPPEDAAEAFAAAQLERGFCTLDFYKQLRRSGGTLR